MRFEPAVFRPTFGRVLTIVVAALAVATVVALALESGVAGVLRSAWPALLVTAVAWAIFWTPQVRVEEHAITVRNIVRTHAVPWAAVQRIDTKWALQLFTADGRITAWAAPAPSRYAVASVDPNDIRIVSGSALPPGEAVRPGDTLGTASGAAAFLIRAHWNELRDDGRLDVPEAARRVRTTWNLRPIVVLGALLVASLVAGLL
jgi:hypothetical protein